MHRLSTLGTSWASGEMHRGHQAREALRIAVAPPPASGRGIGDDVIDLVRDVVSSSTRDH
jgi:hypothetical protein